MDSKFCNQTAGKAENTTDNRGKDVARRELIQTTGVAAATVGTIIMATDDTKAQGVTQTYRFGGEVQGWQGRAPAEIEDSVNPSIELQAGNEHEFWFENIDGAPHNMTIQDAEGNTIVQSSLVTTEGGTGSVTFTATPQMVQYICTIHPTTMVGDVNVTGQLQGQQNGGGLPLSALLIIGGIVMAFISPLLFAVFLFTRDAESQQNRD